MLAGTTYEDVLKTATSEANVSVSGNKYTRTGQLRKIAAKHGVVISCKRSRKFKGWMHLPNKAILAINPNSENRTWHWVVFFREPSGSGAFVLDPNPSIKSNKRTDFGRMRPYAYLPLKIRET